MINLYKDYKKENFKTSGKCQVASGTIENNTQLQSISSLERCKLLTNCLKGDK